MNFDNIMLSEKKPVTQKKKKNHILHDSIYTKYCLKLWIYKKPVRCLFVSG